MQTFSLTNAGASRRRGFTLVELLVVVAVIALLMGLLLPALSKARESGRELKCAANIRNVGQGVTIYTSSSEFFPASYVYPSSNTGMAWKISDQQLENPNPTTGYMHWSSALLEQDNGGVANEAFECPTVYNGGAPRTNPGRESRYWETWQTNDLGGTGSNPSELPEDRQAYRMAYTANAAIMPRNKFSDVGAQRKAQFVRPSWVRDHSRTILATEFLELDNWQSISKDNKSKSHRPLFPFTSPSGASDNDIFNVPDNPGNDSPRWDYPRENQLKRLDSLGAGAIIDADSELNAVGRHHAGKDSLGGSVNFLFIDGHVSKATVLQTIKDRLWGDKVYSITGAGTRLPPAPRN